MKKWSLVGAVLITYITSFSHLVLSGELGNFAQQVAAADDHSYGTTDAENEEDTTDVVHAQFFGTIVCGTLLQEM